MTTLLQLLEMKIMFILIRQQTRCILLKTNTTRNVGQCPTWWSPCRT